MRARTAPAGGAAAGDRYDEIWRRCIARNAGACALVAGGCLACGPIEQSLRAAGWVEARWPRLNGRGKA
ncbi:MAG TPA: hypothetical protein VML91_18290 [Burkholderiales bacterium]|nr:hypothetical protein [Burkholderiales bacterium]